MSGIPGVLSYMKSLEKLRPPQISFADMHISQICPSQLMIPLEYLLHVT